MRRRLAFTSLSFAVALVAFACEEDSNGGGPTIVIPEAGLFDQARPEVNVPDVVPPPPDTVTVLVTSRTGPRAGVSVVFHDALGAALEVKTTGADGKVVRTGASDMVTALLGGDEAPGGLRLFTWTGVTGGDELAVLDEEAPTDFGTLTVTLPGEFSDAGLFGATRYIASLGDCVGDTTGQTINLLLTRHCVAPANNVLLVRADNDLRGFDPALGHAFAKNVGPFDGGDVAAATGPWAHSTPFTVDLLGKEALAQNPFGVLFEVGGSTTISSPSIGDLSVETPATFRTATGFADALVAAVFVDTSNRASNILGERFVPAAGTTSKTFDYAQHLPAILTTDIESSNPQRPFLSWTPESPLGGVTAGGLVDMYFQSPTSRFVTWRFSVAANATNVRTPVLPSPLGDAYLPNADASVTGGIVGMGVVFVHSSSVPNYLAFRKGAGLILPSLGLGFDLTRDLGTMPAGTFKSTAWIPAFR